VNREVEERSPERPDHEKLRLLLSQRYDSSVAQVAYPATETFSSLGEAYCGEAGGHSVRKGLLGHCKVTANPTFDLRSSLAISHC
jgi:hypothetical protein